MNTRDKLMLSVCAGFDGLLQWGFARLFAGAGKKWFSTTKGNRNFDWIASLPVAINKHTDLRKLRAFCFRFLENQQLQISDGSSLLPKY